MDFTAQFLQRADQEKRSFRGLPIVITDPKGTIREGVDPDGRAWKRLMFADYGYIPSTSAAGDEENVDVYVGDDENSEFAFVVEQLGLGKEPDEFKVLLGFPDLQSAEEMYLKHYDPGWEDEHVGAISEVPLEHLFDAVEEHQELEDHQEKTAGVSDVKYKVFRNLKSKGVNLPHKTYPCYVYALDPKYQGTENVEEPDLEFGLNIPSDHVVGFLRVVQDEYGNYYAGKVYLIKDYRRHGIATAMYDAAEKALGKKLVSAPAVFQSEDAKAFWKNRQAADPDLIEKFCAQYERQRGVYGKAADMVRKEIAAACEKQDIRCAVVSRAKEVESLRKKLEKRNALRPYVDFKDIRLDIKDLAGVRVALYFPIERDPVGEIIQKLYKLARPVKHFPEDRGPEDGTVYEADHYAIKYAGLIVEIQVASALMLSYSECAHDLVYKPRFGQLTPFEHQLLEELADIVKAGEHTVDELQEAVFSRVASIKSEAHRIATRLYLDSVLARRDEILAGGV